MPRLPLLSTAKLLRRLCIPVATELGGAEEGAGDATRPFRKETWARGLRMRGMTTRDRENLSEEPGGALSDAALDHPKHLTLTRLNRIESLS